MLSVLGDWEEVGMLTSSWKPIVSCSLPFFSPPFLPLPPFTLFNSAADWLNKKRLTGSGKAKDDLCSQHFLTGILPVCLVSCLTFHLAIPQI